MSALRVHVVTCKPHIMYQCYYSEIKAENQNLFGNNISKFNQNKIKNEEKFEEFLR